jgi:hypothetical protein
MSVDEQPVAAMVPADFDAPDRVLYGLTARQVAILAVAGTLLWLAYQALTPTVPALVFAVVAVPVGGLATAVALGRRDGISMDRWLAAAIRAARAPRRLVAASGGVPPAPTWASATGLGRGRPVVAAVAPLRLPATAIGDNGVVELDDGRLALTAATTVNFDLRSAGEQQSLVAGIGRWLNALSGPVQVIVSTRRVDLEHYARHVEDRADRLPHPALADAAGGYTEFLRDLATDRDPLDRHVLIAHPAGPHSDASVARRAAEHTARALTALGAATRVLDGGQVTDALVGACDPWRNVGTGRATPDTTITGHTDRDLP